MTSTPPHPPPVNVETKLSGAGFPIRSIPIEQLRLNDGAQTRVELSQDAVDDYAEKLIEKGTSIFPPVVVFGDEEHGFWLADGFHRVRATQRAGQKAIMAEIRPGNRREALLYSLGANAAHGVQRTNADKRRSITLLLAEPDCYQWSDRRIAELCSVGNQLVGDVRREFDNAHNVQLCDSHSSHAPAKRFGKDGKSRPSPVGKKDRLQATVKPAQEDNGPHPVSNTTGDHLPTGEQLSQEPSDTGSNTPEIITAEGNQAPPSQTFLDKQVVSAPVEVQPVAAEGTQEAVSVDTVNSVPAVGIIGASLDPTHVEDRLVVTRTIPPMKNYNRENGEAFEECFRLLAATLHRAATEGIAGHVLHDDVLFAVVEATHKFLMKRRKEAGAQRVMGEG